MKETQNFDHAASYAVRNQIARLGYEQFTGTGYPARTTHCWLRGQQGHGLCDTPYY
jgi:hypothetical protein